MDWNTFQTINPILANKASFYPQLSGESTELLKYKNKPLPMGMGSKN